MDRDRVDEIAFQAEFIAEAHLTGFWSIRTEDFMSILIWTKEIPQNLEEDDLL